MIFPMTLFDRYTFYLNFSYKYREFDEILRPYIADYHVIEKALLGVGLWLSLRPPTSSTFSPRSLEFVEICRSPTDRREVTHVK